MTTIDVHAHAVVPDALEEMSASHPEFGPVLVEADGSRFLEYPGRANLGPLPEAIFEPELRLADMERMRVDLQVVAVPPPNFHYHVPVAVGSDFSRIQNDALLALSDSEADRLHVLATLPMQGIDETLREIDRLAAFPRVRGFQIGTNVAGVDLDDPMFEPVWAALESRDLPVLLHPDQRAIAGAERLDEFYLQNLVGLPMESTIAAARLVFGGVIARYPGLRIGFVHGGGFSPFQVGRWDHGWSVRDEPKRTIATEPPSVHYRRLYFDSLTHDAASLRLLGERVGWRHVMLGSDYPFDMASDDPVAAVEALALDQDDLRAVLGGNAGDFLRPIRPA
jgi:aminocarboxymuconate-semialdehyde decarboxylase